MHDAFLQRQAQNKTLPAGLYGQARPFMNEALLKTSLPVRQRLHIRSGT